METGWGEYLNKVIEGDCLDVLTIIKDQSIDMVLCDLPYGITQNKWDSPIDLVALWAQYKRIVKPNGVIALTGQGRFTGQLIESNPDWFKYKIVWIKSKATNFLNAKKQPLRRHEDICIFYGQQPEYSPQKTMGVPYDRGFRKDNSSGTYGTYKTRRIRSIDGMRYPHDFIFVEEDLIDWIYCKTSEADGIFHPTQKPVALGRWLIRTYSKPGEVILDNACGSGSFLVAAVLEHRQFIGIEMNDRSLHFGKEVNYVEISKQRVKNALVNRNTLF